MAKQLVSPGRRQLARVLQIAASPADGVGSTPSGGWPGSSGWLIPAVAPSPRGRPVLSKADSGR